jgi:hypothetical protein
MVCLILFATYITAMFHMRTEEMVIRYQSLDEMSKQTYYKLGSVRNSPTWNFFCDNKNKNRMYQRVCNLMKSPNAAVKDIQDGFQRVQDGGFGFFETTPVIKSQVS